MTVFNAVLLILKLASTLIDYLERRSLMKEGEVKALTRLLEDINEKVDKAASARDSVNDSPDSVSRDPNNRDNWGPTDDK